MEFNLRIQEFVELIRSDRRIDAIKHARKHFPSFEEEHLSTIQQVMALLAFPVTTGKPDDFDSCFLILTILKHIVKQKNYLFWL